jgi:hypothetical protein
MSEQAPNSQNPHENAVASIENMFREKEGLPPEKPRNPDGTFAKTTVDDPFEKAQADEPVTETAGESEGEAQETQPQSEEVEVDFDFGTEKRSYRIPKEISDRFIQHADYTRKTQDLAELRRVTSAEREVSNLEKAFEQQTVQERQQMSLLDAQIAQYQSVNWGAIEDTGQLIKLREQLNQLKDQRATVAEAIKAKRSGFDEKIKSFTQEAKTAGLKYIQQHIKGYDEKIQESLKDYGLREGYTQDELSRIIDPRIVVSLWKASQWDALQSSKAGVLNKAQQAAPVVRPGATQKSVSRVQAAENAIKKATTPKGKQQATEDYFAARFGEK